DPNFAQHLADDDLDMFVVNRYALEPVHFLHFVYQMFLQLLWPANLEDFVRINRTFGQLLAFLNIIALENDDMLADWNQMFLFDRRLLILDHDATLATDAR